ncbi:MULTISPECIES: GNAT family N-acetyltransferase [Microbacterium]|uniref:GNAT family N-acetyltransferase n=1 Tax=Microbacterium wangchenii TaxID=2541726 RepID=A0ABX5SUX0_9MICO|nr:MULTISPECIES: GNAT family N-acetyltransferase [Microbacterium]MCK6065632.1 GNAT family N-acetyltransferase [Microbacterium sp. EYE_512]QBR89050.1 GNAT family N-acetyltransferase [Microbacterium wangchenii]TFV81868.1 GNAT family N-acetyltransferase [Microbacterium sp. dk485]TXK20770.1 GNAT family N-acetyltransferase [Microbacterium wangchenii]
MSTSPAGLELRPLPLPASVDADDAGDFVEMVRVRNLISTEISGHDDFHLAPHELLPAYAPDPNERRMLWVVVLDGEMVGRVGVDIPLEEGSRVAYWLVELRRSVWGRGIGTAASELVERTARAHRRTVLQSWAQHPASADPRLPSPTGFGSVPRDHSARFYLRHGHTLEQVERISALDLTDPRLNAHLQGLLEQATVAAEGYRVVQWELPTPPEFVEGYAWMKSRMITDAPAAGLEFDEEVWDADRLRRHERFYLDARRRMLVTAAQHVDSGDIVAFNELVVGGDGTQATQQEDTLVLSEHRGHRLGMLVKCAALIAWRSVAPGSPRVLTTNAEENRPMLDINEAIGFVPIAYEGGWKKVLSPGE